MWKGSVETKLDIMRMSGKIVRNLEIFKIHENKRYSITLSFYHFILLRLLNVLFLE